MSLTTMFIFASNVMYIVLAAVIAIAIAEDARKYCDLCQPGTSSGDRANHTMCIYQGIGPGCTDALDGGVKPEERRLILDVHNRLRARVASGVEARGLPGGVPQPPASNMMALNWDEELATVAQLWADQCNFQHDCRHVGDFKVGQNIAQYWNDLAPVVQWPHVVENWYDEVGNWSAVDTPKFRFTGVKMMTAHYTQVVWAQTRFVGCGRRGFRNGPFYVEHYVCNYGPTGNYWNEPLYLVGEPCALCPEDSGCTDGVLCVAGAEGRTDIYAYRYQHETTVENVTYMEEIGDLNVTSGPEDNELHSSDLEEKGKALWKKWLVYVVARYTQM